MFRIYRGALKVQLANIPADKKGKDAGGDLIALVRERTLLSNLTPEMIATSTSNQA